MDIDPYKYLTVRRADLSPDLQDEVQAWEVLDAVVLRKSDKLTVGALHAYATACDTTADILIGLGQTKEAEELTAIATYFYTQYEEAHTMQDHLPTL